MQQIKVAGLVDIGTTGLNPARDEIIELCIILFSFNSQTGQIIKILDKYCGLQEPSVPIGKRANRVLGISKNSVRGMSLNNQRIKSLIAQCELIIAHNARFHSAFITRLFSEAAEKPWLCSMNGIDWQGKGFLSRSLHRLLKAHGIESPSKHRSKYNAMAALSFLSNAGSDNESYLLELLASNPISLETSFEQETASCLECSLSRDDIYPLNYGFEKIDDRETGFLTNETAQEEETEDRKEKSYFVHSGFCAAFASSSILFILDFIYGSGLSKISYSIALLAYFICISFNKQKAKDTWDIMDLVYGFFASAGALAIASLITGFLIKWF